MVFIREPLIHPLPIASLRPTQMTVGMREVEEKRRRWRKHGGSKKAEFLGSHMIPAIIGPKDRRYIIDHHHLARALHEEEVVNVLVTVIADLSKLPKEEFWVFLDHRAWAHPYDASGRRRSFEDIPKTVAELKDDPFRSVAGELRRAGAFAKDTTPFSEFLWADFLRRRMKRALVASDFDAAMKDAQTLARSLEANHLPGWSGPADQD